MNTKSSIAIAVCLVVLSSAAVQADRFAPQHLFTLSYGSGPGEIGIWVPGSEEGAPDGPSGIAVGRDGSVYIADSINRRIQRLSASGELLMEARGPVDRRAEDVAAYERGRGAEVPPRIHELENIQCIAVDSQGCVYVQFGAAIDLLAKFTADGRALWYMHMADAIPLEARKTYGPLFGGISIGPADTLCMRLCGRSLDGIAVFDADGRFLRAVDGYMCAPNGNIVALESSARGTLVAGVRMYDADGMEIASFIADPTATDPAVFVGMHSLSGTALDGTDNLYMFSSGLRVQPVVLSPALRIGTDTAVARFNLTGRVSAGVRFPGSPFPSPGYITIDYAGNIYRLAYGADCVDVIKYALDTSASQYTSLRDD